MGKDVKSVPKLPGQPSKYRKKYVKALIEHMTGGYSFESFAAVISVHRDTLYNWVRLYPEFSDAKKRGTDASYYFWEKLGMTGMTGKIRGFNSAVWIFSVKNRFGWVDSPIAPPEKANDELKEALDELDRQEAEKRKGARK